MSSTEKKEYPEISEFGYIKDDKVYLKGYFEFKDREIGVVRESEEESIKYFVNRFEMVKKKVEAVKESIATSENKGSFLMKLIHMRTYLAQYNGLGNFISLYDEINDMEDDIRVYIEQNREKNYEIKSALLTEAKSLKGSTDWRNTGDKFKELKLKWIKTGSAHKEVDDQLTKDFNDALEYFFENRRSYFAEQARITEEKMAKFRQLNYQIQAILKAGGDPKDIQRVKNIQKEWKALGRISHKNFRYTSNNFRKNMDAYFNGLKYKAATQNKSVIEIKRDLYKEIEDILNERRPFQMNEVKQIQMKWKQLGKQPNLDDKEINLKFRIACNELFEGHFLEKSTKYFHPDYFKKSPKEQVELKINVLNESIKKDEKELEDYQKKHAFELAQGTRTSANSAIFQERNNFVNKLKTKGRILSKLEEKYERL
ncbi:DUF349 domain-containing protein [Flexithrix dorotheae]|uniref:DUF349 domain-containing protein n=1 Tax=Flexithrix dorotheae TaxID=70993 RepID=UPI00036B3DA1|nr:DUF349 domain-containing protein [Flexithrix dorotheae]